MYTHWLPFQHYHWSERFSYGEYIITIMNIMYRSTASYSSYRLVDLRENVQVSVLRHKTVWVCPKGYTAYVKLFWWSRCCCCCRYYHYYYCCCYFGAEVANYYNFNIHLCKVVISIMYTYYLCKYYISISEHEYSLPPLLPWLLLYTTFIKVKY